MSTRFVLRTIRLSLARPRYKATQPQLMQDTSLSAPPPPFPVQQGPSCRRYSNRPCAKQYADYGRPSPMQCQLAPVLPVASLSMLSPAALSSLPESFPPGTCTVSNLRFTTRAGAVSVSWLAALFGPGLLRRLFLLPRHRLSPSPPHRLICPKPFPRRPTFSTRLVKRPHPQRRVRCLNRRSWLKPYQRGLYHTISHKRAQPPPLLSRSLAHACCQHLERRRPRPHAQKMTVPTTVTSSLTSTQTPSPLLTPSFKTLRPQAYKSRTQSLKTIYLKLPEGVLSTTTSPTATLTPPVPLSPLAAYPPLVR